MYDYLELASKATTPKELGRHIGAVSKDIDSNDLAWRMSDWRTRDKEFDKWYDLIQESVVFTIGTYDEDLLHTANRQSFEEIFKDELQKGRYIFESHCIAYTTVYIVHPRLFLKLCDEFLYPLSQYPLIDDDLHSKLEWDQFEETINDETDSYWRREIEEDWIDQGKFKARVWHKLRDEKYDNTIMPGDISYSALEEVHKNVHRAMRTSRKSKHRPYGMREMIRKAAQVRLW